MSERRKYTDRMIDGQGTMSMKLGEPVTQMMAMRMRHFRRAMKYQQ